jgi:hypothetical protein
MSIPASSATASRGLAGRGKQFWSAVVGEFIPRVDEVEILVQACRAISRLEALEAAMAGAPPLVPGSTGRCGRTLCSRRCALSGRCWRGCCGRSNTGRPPGVGRVAVDPHKARPARCEGEVGWPWRHILTAAGGEPSRELRSFPLWWSNRLALSSPALVGSRDSRRK